MGRGVQLYCHRRDYVSSKSLLGMFCVHARNGGMRTWAVGIIGQGRLSIPKQDVAHLSWEARQPAGFRASLLKGHLGCGLPHALPCGPACAAPLPTPILPLPPRPPPPASCMSLSPASVCMEVSGEGAKRRE